MADAKATRRPNAGPKHGYHKRRQPPQRGKNFRRNWTTYVPASTLEDGAESPFRLCCFNVLADYLATSHTEMYPGSDVEWSHRRGLLLKEIFKLDPDIICLQEVDHFEDFFQPELEENGYSGFYKQRTGETTEDGCAIFFKRAKFDAIQVLPIELFQSEESTLNRHNVALALVLQPITKTLSPPTPFVVATTHILFNPNRGEVKLAQLQWLLQYLSNVIGAPVDGDDEPKLGSEKRMPLILAGDFNLTPQSALYEYLSRGELNLTGLSRHVLSGQDYSSDKPYQRLLYKRGREKDPSRHKNCGTAALRFNPSEANRTHSDFPEETVSHNLGLSSAYAQNPTDECTGEPAYTTFHSRSKITVDYLWYTNANLRCCGVLETIPIGLLLSASDPLPSGNLGSDHLSLVADFQLT